ncbi:MAG: succinate dehydrogenase iron-sulfur subunit [Bacillota bacterium]|nr:MAG: succinate dehydrogenase iron-sulfur subunit [Bacillota bacterium]
MSIEMKQRPEKIRLNVYRFDPEVDKAPRIDSFDVPWVDGMTVLDTLFYVLEKRDGSLAFRYSCREGICGACAMYINGSHRLACETQVARLLDEGHAEVRVMPLPHLPVIKDLVVDMTRFWENYEAIAPWIVTRSADPEKEHLQSPEDRKLVDEYVGCILCGSCFSSCPSVWTGKEYLGPNALMKTWRWVADTRDSAAEERLGLVGNERGAWRCHTVFNCVEACPKDINQTTAIQGLKRRTVGAMLRGSKALKAGRKALER